MGYDALWRGRIIWLRLVQHTELIWAFGVFGVLGSFRARVEMSGGVVSDRMPSCSSCHESSCPMKLKLGEITRRFAYAEKTVMQQTSI